MPFGDRRKRIMKNKMVLFALLFFAAFVLTIKAEAKSFYLQKNAAYQMKQFVNKKVKKIKYDKKYIKLKNGKVIPKKTGKTSVTFITKSKKKRYSFTIVKKVGFSLSIKVTRDVGEKFQLHFTDENGAVYSSTNKKVAIVSKTGLVRFLKRGKATIKAKYLGKTYKVQVICRARRVGKIFHPNLEKVVTVKIRMKNSKEHICTKEEMTSIFEMINNNSWYYYTELPNEKKEEMNYTIIMVDESGNETVCIQVEPGLKRIRVKDDGVYQTPYGFSLPDWILYL